MTRRVLAAAVQMTSTADVESNLGTAERLVAEAARRGAAFVGLPENFAFLRSEGQPVPGPQALDGPWVARMAELARRHSLTLLLGSLPERIEGDGRVYNTSVLLGPDGAVRATYRKIHLFDIDLPGMEHLKESRAVRPGAAPVVAQTAFGPLGLSICYDVRFPELYRLLARSGARVLAVPSAFTDRTGRDHWEVLLRARAIENAKAWPSPPWTSNPRTACAGSSLPWTTSAWACRSPAAFDPGPPFPHSRRSGREDEAPERNRHDQEVRRRRRVGRLHVHVRPRRGRQG
jgi:predicted amidohydrolase